MPQLNPEFFVSQLFWLVITFGFLYVFLWRVSLPRINSALSRRQNKIDENLAMAKEYQEKALGIEKTIEDKINLAKEKADNEVKDKIKSLQEITEKRVKELDIELENKILETEKMLINNKKNALKDIDDQILEITKLSVSKLININLSDDDINQAIKKTEKRIN